MPEPEPGRDSDESKAFTPPLDAAAASATAGSSSTPNASASVTLDAAVTGDGAERPSDEGFGRNANSEAPIDIDDEAEDGAFAEAPEDTGKIEREKDIGKVGEEERGAGVGNVVSDLVRSEGGAEEDVRAEAEESAEKDVAADEFREEEVVREEDVVEEEGVVGEERVAGEEEEEREAGKKEMGRGNGRESSLDTSDFQGETDMFSKLKLAKGEGPSAEDYADIGQTERSQSQNEAAIRMRKLLSLRREQTRAQLRPDADGGKGRDRGRGARSEEVDVQSDEDESGRKPGSGKAEKDDDERNGRGGRRLVRIDIGEEGEEGENGQAGEDGGRGDGVEFKGDGNKHRRKRKRSIEYFGDGRGGDRANDDLKVCAPLKDTVWAPWLSHPLSRGDTLGDTRRDTRGDAKRAADEGRGRAGGRNGVEEPLDLLERELRAYLAWSEPSEAEIRDRLEAWCRASLVIKALWPQSETSLFGSFCTGLSLPTGDLDLCVLNVETGGRSGVRGGPPAGSLSDRLMELVRVLRRCPFAKNLTAITRARIPIAKYVDDVSTINVDLSINQPSAAETSTFIKATLAKHKILRPLILITKTVFRQMDLNETYKGGIGSYMNFVLCLYHLQCESKDLSIPPCPHTHTQTHTHTPAHTQKKTQSQGDVECDCLVRHSLTHERALTHLGYLIFTFMKRLLTLDYFFEGIDVRNGGSVYHKTEMTGLLNEPEALLSIKSPLEATTDLGRNSYKWPEIVDLLKWRFDRLLSACTAYENRRPPSQRTRTPHSVASDGGHGMGNRAGNAQIRGPGKRRRGSGSKVQSGSKRRSGNDSEGSEGSGGNGGRNGKAASAGGSEASAESGVVSEPVSDAEPEVASDDISETSSKESEVWWHEEISLLSSFLRHDDPPFLERRARLEAEGKAHWRKHPPSKYLPLEESRPLPRITKQTLDSVKRPLERVLLRISPSPSFSSYSTGGGESGGAGGGNGGYGKEQRRRVYPYEVGSGGPYHNLGMRGHTAYQGRGRDGSESTAIRGRREVVRMRPHISLDEPLPSAPWRNDNQGRGRSPSGLSSGSGDRPDRGDRGWPRDATRRVTETSGPSDAPYRNLQGDSHRREIHQREPRGEPHRSPANAVIDLDDVVMPSRPNSQSDRRNPKGPNLGGREARGKDGECATWNSERRNVDSNRSHLSSSEAKTNEAGDDIQMCGGPTRMPHLSPRAYQKVQRPIDLW